MVTIEEDDPSSASVAINDDEYRTIHSEKTENETKVRFENRRTKKESHTSQLAVPLASASSTGSSDDGNVNQLHSGFEAPQFAPPSSSRIMNIAKWISNLVVGGGADGTETAATTAMMGDEIPTWQHQNIKSDNVAIHERREFMLKPHTQNMKVLPDAWWIILTFGTLFLWSTSMLRMIISITSTTVRNPLARHTSPVFDYLGRGCGVRDTSDRPYLMIPPYPYTDLTQAALDINQLDFNAGVCVSDCQSNVPMGTSFADMISSDEKYGGGLMNHRDVYPSMSFNGIVCVPRSFFSSAQFFDGMIQNLNLDSHAARYWSAVRSIARSGWLVLSAVAISSVLCAAVFYALLTMPAGIALISAFSLAPALLLSAAAALAAFGIRFQGGAFSGLTDSLGELEGFVNAHVMAIRVVSLLFSVCLSLACVGTVYVSMAALKERFKTATAIFSATQNCIIGSKSLRILPVVTTFTVTLLSLASIMAAEFLVTFNVSQETTSYQPVGDNIKGRSLAVYDYIEPLVFFDENTGGSRILQESKVLGHYHDGVSDSSSAFLPWRQHHKDDATRISSQPPQQDEKDRRFQFGFDDDDDDDDDDIKVKPASDPHKHAYSMYSALYEAHNNPRGKNIQDSPVQDSPIQGSPIQGSLVQDLPTTGNRQFYLHSEGEDGRSSSSYHPPPPVQFGINNRGDVNSFKRGGGDTGRSNFRDADLSMSAPPRHAQQMDFRNLPPDLMQKLREFAAQRDRENKARSYKNPYNSPDVDPTYVSPPGRGVYYNNPRDEYALPSSFSDDQFRKEPPIPPQQSPVEVSSNDIERLNAKVKARLEALRKQEERKPLEKTVSKARLPMIRDETPSDFGKTMVTTRTTFSMDLINLIKIVLFSLSSWFLLEFSLSAMRFAAATLASLWYFTMPDYSGRRDVTLGEEMQSCLMRYHHLGTMSLLAAVNLMCRPLLTIISLLSVGLFSSSKFLRRSTRHPPSIRKLTNQLVLQSAKWSGEAITQAVVHFQGSTEAQQASVEWLSPNENRTAMEILRFSSTLITSLLSLLFFSAGFYFSIKVVTTFDMFKSPESAHYISNPMLVSFCIAGVVFFTSVAIFGVLLQVADSIAYCFLMERSVCSTHLICAPVQLIESIPALENCLAELEMSKAYTHAQPLFATPNPISTTTGYEEAGGLGIEGELEQSAVAAAFATSMRFDDAGASPGRPPGGGGCYENVPDSNSGADTSEHYRARYIGVGNFGYEMNNDDLCSSSSAVSDCMLSPVETSLPAPNIVSPIPNNNPNPPKLSGENGEGKKTSSTLELLSTAAPSVATVRGIGDMVSMLNRRESEEPRRNMSARDKQQS